MLVDLEVLRTFADETSGAAETITSNTLAGKVIESFAGMQGPSSRWAAVLVDGFTKDLTSALAGGFDALATAARGTADSFEVTDDDLATGIGKVLR